MSKSRSILPLKVRRTRYSRLSKLRRAAIDSACDKIRQVPTDCPVRVETYRTEDIRYLVESVWKWPATLTDMKSEHSRVRTIMRLIPTEGAWPYVSYRALDMEDLMQTTQEDDYLSIPNHGDGWHRIIACIELGLPTIDILFLG